MAEFSSVFKVSRQYLFFILVRVRMMEGKDLGSEKGKDLGSGVCYVQRREI